MKRSLILALFFLLAPARADEPDMVVNKTAPCSSIPAIALAEPDIVFVGVPFAVNIFKAKAEVQSDQAKVLSHILRGKPCQTPGLIRWMNQCYTPENLKLVKKEQ